MQVYNNKINKNTKWSGDNSTFGFPVSGDRVEEFIKESLQKKAGYIYQEGNNLLVFADEVDYETYSQDHSKRDLIIQWISIYNHIAYANKDSQGNIIDFSTSVSEGKDYFGICINSSENNPENPSEYNWVYIKGAPGTNGLDGRDGIDGLNGLNGINGQDGITPTIDPSTKHWMIGDIDTGVVAEGINGQKGEPGTNGLDGKDGKDGSNGTNGINGTNGLTPRIDPTTQHWMIGEVDTEILAIGRTPHIDYNTKHWIIGEEDTGILAEGTKGERGLNAPYQVTTYGKSSYSQTNSSTGPSDIVTWTQDIPQRTVGTFIWMRVQNYSGEGLLQNTQYTCITGDTGQKGKWYEYAGVWSIDDIQSVTNSTSIGYYVKYGNKFYMNIASDGEINNTVPGPNNPKWEEMPADRQFYIAKAFFGDYAEFGSGIINGDWMISKIGVSDSPSNNPHDFDPDSPNTINMDENNFIPIYALNLSNGMVYMNDANLKGTINASSGSIGGFNIQSNGIFNSIAGDAEIYPKINFEFRDSGISCFSNFDVSGLKFELYNSRLHQSIITNEINSNGSGSLGQGGISWDNDGDFTITDKFVEAIFKVLAQGEHHSWDPDGSTIQSSDSFNFSNGIINLSGFTGTESRSNRISSSGISLDEGRLIPYSSSLTASHLEISCSGFVGDDEFTKTSINDNHINIEKDVEGDTHSINVTPTKISLLHGNSLNGSIENVDTIIGGEGIKIFGSEYIYLANDVRVQNNETYPTYFSVEADRFIKHGGTSSQPLMADGSVKTGYTGNVNLGTHTLVIEGGIITNVTQNNS